MNDILKYTFLIALTTLMCSCSTIESNQYQSLNSPKTFTDCLGCPEMVVIPAGTYLMGSPQDEPGRNADNRNHDEDDTPGPGGSRIEVKVPGFALGAHEVTNKQFEAFILDSGYSASGDCFVAMNDSRLWEKHTEGGWDNPGRDTKDDHAATCIDWYTAKAFVHWLSIRTGYKYRLPSESEFEYSLRAGTDTPYHFGHDAEELCKYGNVPDATLKEASPERKTLRCNDGFESMAPVGQFKANGFGLYDMTGNVWEWLEDCYQNSYAETPQDGSPLTKPECSAYSIRGGSWGYDIPSLRSADRSDDPPELRFDGIGFRVARDLMGGAPELPNWNLRVFESATNGFSLLYPNSYSLLAVEGDRVFSAVAPYQVPRIDVDVTETQGPALPSEISEKYLSYVSALHGTNIEVVSTRNVRLGDNVSEATEVVIKWELSVGETKLQSIFLSAVNEGKLITIIVSGVQDERIYDWADIVRLAYTIRPLK